ncbi:MAG: hydrogenase formation protein HypD, partial [Methanobacteriota archaeon]
GCPVCITPAEDVLRVAHLARSGVVVTTYGDMLRVPANGDSLLKTKNEGYDIRVVYSITNAVQIAEKNPDKEVVHFGIGFETTAPTSSVVLLDAPSNFSLYSVHRLIPPALGHLLQLGESRIDGFIDPGHVSTIIGSDTYKPISQRYNVPQVVAGFRAVDILLAIYILLKQIENGENLVVNEYSRVVRPEGNRKARKLLEETFDVVDAEWRGLGYIKGSGLEVKEEFSEWDAKRRHEDLLANWEPPRQQWVKGCRCGEVLRGLIFPEECKLYGKVCKPETPVGPCMVSREGACAIAYRFQTKPGLWQ